MSVKLSKKLTVISIMFLLITMSFCFTGCNNKTEQTNSTTINKVWQDFNGGAHIEMNYQSGKSAKDCQLGYKTSNGNINWVNSINQNNEYIIPTFNYVYDNSSHLSGLENYVGQELTFYVRLAETDKLKASAESEGCVYKVKSAYSNFDVSRISAVAIGDGDKPVLSGTYQTALDNYYLQEETETQGSYVTNYLYSFDQNTMTCTFYKLTYGNEENKTNSNYFTATQINAANNDLEFSVMSSYGDPNNQKQWLNVPNSGKVIFNQNQTIIDDTNNKLLLVAIRVKENTTHAVSYSNLLDIIVEDNA